MEEQKYKKFHKVTVNLSDYDFSAITIGVKDPK